MTIRPRLGDSASSLSLVLLTVIVLAAAAANAAGPAANAEERIAKVKMDLKSADVAIRRSAIDSLVHSDISSKLLPEIQTALDDRDGGIRSVAATAIGTHGAEAIPAIGQLIVQLKSDPVKEARETAARALGRIGKVAPDEKQLINPLRTASQEDADPVTRVVAIGALAMINVDPAGQIDSLRKYLHHDDALVREKACHALGMIGKDARAAAPEIVEALNRETDHHRRGYEARALGNVGDPASLPVLEAALEKETDAGAKGEMRGAIGRLKALAADEAAPKSDKFAIWPNDLAPIGDGNSEKTNTFITVHLPPAEKANGAALVICPGGGYQRLVVEGEGHGIAQWLNGHGIAGIVLEYRMPHGRPYVPLLDAQRAIRIVRARAGEWKLDPKRIGIIGFSAGGHLASTAGTHFDEGKPDAVDPIERVSSRPDFQVLVYPVITMTDKGSALTRTNLLGREPKPDLLDLFSNEKQVTDRTPPAFLAHAVDDKSVPIENSRMFRDALEAHHVVAEYLELPSGGHGLNNLKGPMWDAWQIKSLEWLVAQKMIPAADAGNVGKSGK